MFTKESITAITVVTGAFATGNWWVAIIAIALSVKYFVLVPAERLAEFERELYHDMRECNCHTLLFSKTRRISL